jgi:hypothetical protein
LVNQLRNSKPTIFMNGHIGLNLQFTVFLFSFLFFAIIKLGVHVS